jgi:hypothetical protein
LRTPILVENLRAVVRGYGGHVDLIRRVLPSNHGRSP